MGDSGAWAAVLGGHSEFACVMNVNFHSYGLENMWLKYELEHMKPELTTGRALYLLLEYLGNYYPVCVSELTDDWATFGFYMLIYFHA